MTPVAKTESLCESPNLLDESSKAENLPWDLAGKLRPILSTAYALHCKNVVIHNWITDVKRLLHFTGFHIQPRRVESKFGYIWSACCRLNLVACTLNTRHKGLSPARVANSGASGFSVQLMIPRSVILSQVLKQSAAWSSDCAVQMRDFCYCQGSSSFWWKILFIHLEYLKHSPLRSS